MASKYTIPVVLLLSLISLQLIKLGHGSGVHTSIHCLEFEREALLGFARGFNQTEYPFSSWVGKNCCRWEGVHCDKTNGHVTGLVVWVLSNDYSPTIPQQLGNLSSLQSLLLYGPDYIDGSPPLIVDNAHWLSRLTSLQELGMGFVSFDKASGWLDALNMLPSLRSIEFSDCVFGSFPLSLAHVNITSVLGLSFSSSSTKSRIPSWLFQLSNLQYLDLSYTDFQGPIPATIGNLTSLETLDLGGTSHLLPGMPQTLSNLCKVRELSFDGSSFNQRLDDLGRCFSGCIRNSLNVLDLNDASLSGNLPDWIAGLKNLTDLDLSMNSLSGPLPKSLGQVSQLAHLDLFLNSLSGPVPRSLGQLSQLAYLDLSYNSLEGELTEEHFANLTRLNYLAVEFNFLVLNVNSDWVPPFQLDHIDMSSCPVGPKFPSWLQTQWRLGAIYLSNSGIVDSIPEWLWINLTSLEILDLSHNVISSTIPHLPSNIRVLYLANTSLQGPIPPNISKIFPDLEFLDLSTNSMNGSIPPSLCGLVNLRVLDISNNNLSGELPPFLHLANTSLQGPIPPNNINKIFPDLAYLDLSANSINGSIPSSLCDLVNLEVLDISNNNLSGELPPCEKHFPESLFALLLSNNNIMGGIPSWLCLTSSLNYLHLSNNRMSGDFPPSLKGCEELMGLDLGGNRFSGSIPTWVVKSLPNLEWLRLRSNMFTGEIPQELSQIEHLHVVDLSHNNFSGAIPRSFGNFSFMQTPDGERWLSLFIPMNIFNPSRKGYTEKMRLDTKGREDLYESQPLALITVIDLSENNLYGSIPEELISLATLVSLNLSGNHLRGEISKKIGNMLQLESLDLSRNELSGTIPYTLTNLNFLSSLNLSYNNLSGRIPTGKQLDTINDPSSYIGNPFLCGLPLMKTCEGDGTTDRVPNDADGDGNVQAPDSSSEGEEEMVWFYLGIAPGYAVGFWTILGVLLLNKTWRTMYFQFVDNSYDRIFVAILLSFKRLKGKFLEG